MDSRGAVEATVLLDYRLHRGIKGLSSGPKLQQVDILLSHPDSPPLRSALPVNGTKGGTSSGQLAASGRSDGMACSKAGGPELQHLEQRLDRTEQLVALIA